MHMYIHMARNVALSDKVYNELDKFKRHGESFSEVITRLIEREEKVSWRNSIGALKTDKEAEKIFEQILENRHKNAARSPRF